jgi:alpha-tubulin suppressor-like RCC1 family protein
VQLSGLTSVARLAGGNRHSLALKTDGTVVAWGDNTGVSSGTAPTFRAGRHASQRPDRRQRDRRRAVFLGGVEGGQDGLDMG